ncbi:MAG: flagellar assembly protein T N-terminal domain-containing protein, partial [Alphaproteobacteria bacterium]|nr:flagellar assembly protein T N-terminal domain-containing protein [Alphaproteobacteria bacterium]
MKNKLAALVLLSFISSPLSAEEDKNFKQVEATGRSVVIDGNIEVSRKRALEDALYLAALKGGADVNGFSAINSSTIINDQSVIRATNRVIDFKILNERQDKEFLSIKISAIVGGKKSSKNCTTKPINITFFKGSFINDSSIPSKLSRKTPKWYNAFFDIISELPNVVS